MWHFDAFVYVLVNLPFGEYQLEIGNQSPDDCTCFYLSIEGVVEFTACNHNNVSVLTVKRLS